MAPFIVNVTCPPLESTTNEPPDLGKDDLNALLYIVVTLLFYSMGIIIGIITYLKREQADMAEDQVFDLYISFKQEPFNMHKKEKVRQMAVYLKQIEEAKLAREKIEAWSAEQTQKSGNSGSDVAESIPTYGTSLSFPGASGAAVDVENGGGASALLCSLTLGVCEPLLAPEGTIAKATASTKRKMIPFGHSKGKAQRHSVPSMDHPGNLAKGILREHQRSYHEKRSGFVLHPNRKGHQPVIELKDLRRSKFERDLSTCKDDANDYSSSDEDSEAKLFRRHECDQSFHMPLFPNNENIPAFKRAAYASEKRKNKKIFTDQISSDKDSDFPDEDSSHPSTAERDSRDTESFENEACSIVVTGDSLSKSDLSVHCSGKPGENNSIEHIKADTKGLTLTLDLPVDKDNEVLEKKRRLYEPLTLDNTLLQPFPGTAATKSKLVTNSLTNIPRDVTRGDEIPQRTNRSISPRFDSWRQGGSKTVDIPDAKAPQFRNKSEKLQGRRGALLFAQKSLHHIENESPKPGTAKRYFSGQESTDSYSSSRTTDSTDACESPQLPLAFDRGQGSAEAGVTNLQPASRKNERRIPKLMRSKTVDSSKSPPL